MDERKALRRKEIAPTEVIRRRDKEIHIAE